MRPAAARFALFASLLSVGSMALAAAQPKTVKTLQSLSQLQGGRDGAFVRRAFRLGDSDVHVLRATWNNIEALFVDYSQDQDSDAPERPLIALEQVPRG